MATDSTHSGKAPRQHPHLVAIGAVIAIIASAALGIRWQTLHFTSITQNSIRIQTIPHRRESGNNVKSFDTVIRNFDSTSIEPLVDARADELEARGLRHVHERLSQSYTEVGELIENAREVTKRGRRVAAWLRKLFPPPRTHW